MAKARLGKNVLYNLAGTVVPLVTAFVTIPHYLGAIGDVRFGILSLIWLVFGYFGLFDLGVSRATVNHLSQLRSGTAEERNTVRTTALVLAGSLGVATSIIFYVSVSIFLPKMLGADQHLAPELMSALPWIALLFPVSMAGSVLSGMLDANEDFFRANRQQIIGSMLFQCLPLLFVTQLGPSLVYAIWGATLARVISVAWLATIATREMRDSPLHFSKPEAKSLLKYGGWITVSNGISPLLSSLDQFLIASVLGAKQLTYYAIPANVSTKVLGLPLAVTRALFPRLSHMDKASALELSRSSVVTVSWIMAIICAPMIRFSEVLLGLWINPEFAVLGAPVMQIIFLGIWVNGVAQVPYAMLLASGRPDVMAKFHIIEILPYVGILWFLLKVFGVPGAALAWSLRVAVDTGLLLSAAKFGRRTLINTMLPGVLVLLSWAGMHLWRPGRLGDILLGLLIGAIAVIGCICADKKVREMLTKSFQRLRPSPG